jgi:hypothetical protein
MVTPGFNEISGNRRILAAVMIQLYDGSTAISDTEPLLSSMVSIQWSKKMLVCIEIMTVGCFCTVVCRTMRWN